MKNTFKALILAGVMAIPSAAMADNDNFGARHSNIGSGYHHSSNVNAEARYRDMNAGSRYQASVAPRVHYMERKEVQAIQQTLEDSGFYKGSVDGVWGPKTVKAVKDFQVSSGLEPTGSMNMETLDQMGLQLSAADQIETANEPIEYQAKTPMRPVGQYSADQHDRVEGTNNMRAYTHVKD